MSLFTVALVGLAAFLVGTLASLAGYGQGLLMPIVLVPLIGAQAVVPVLAVAGLLSNGSRIAAFRDAVDWPVALRLMITATPACLVGATTFTRLDGAQASILIGAFLLTLVPGRRVLKRMVLARGLMVALVGGAIYGFLLGLTPGVGVIIIPILMSMGLSGKAVIATDATLSLVVGLAKVATFQALGAMSPAMWGLALVIGLCALPGAFVARWLMDRLNAQVHEAILDIGVVAGGISLILRGLGYI